MPRVTESEVGRIVRALRHRQRLRQADLARMSGVPRAELSAIENGRLWKVPVVSIGRALNAMDARLDLRVEWHGAALDRLLDEGHARLVGEVVQRLRRLGWMCEMEVTYSQAGERGSVDVLAWHPGSATLLVVEVKTELASIEGLLRSLDAKTRLARSVAAQRLGWSARTVGRCVVLPDATHTRRAVARHAAVLDVVLPARSMAVRTWLRAPSGRLSGLWILSSARLAGTRQNPSSIRRVRLPKPRSPGPPPAPGHRPRSI